MLSKEGANLPKDLDTLVDKFIYFRASKKELASLSKPITCFTPNKYYLIKAVGCRIESLSAVLVYVTNDHGKNCRVYLGKHTCAYLGSELYWSIAKETKKAKVARIIAEQESKSNG